MPTAEKVAVVEELTDVMRQSQGIYLTDFSGLDVTTFTELRKRLHKESVSCRVVKNRLALRAAKEAGVEGLDEMFQGPTGLVCSETDPLIPVRVITEFAKGAEGRPKIKAGLVDGTVYVDEQLERLASLPSREVLLTQLAVVLQSPISGLVYSLNGLLQNLVVVLNAIADKKGEAGGEAPAADAS
ncbi:MAG: 50S ribosomal protein L10 [bacterium]|nr:50S ribosomal protein L10 [bacterium]